MVRKPKTVEPEVQQIDTAPPQADDTPSTAPAPDAETPPAAPNKGPRAPFALGAGVGILAAALGYGAALQFPLTPSNTPPAADLAPIIARLDALEAAAAQAPATDPQLLARLSALESAPQADMADLTARLTALENRLDAAPSDSDIRAQLAQIQEKLAQTDPAPAIKAAIAAEMGAVKASVQGLQDAAAETAQKAAESAALTLLRAALDTGGPYLAAAQSLTLPPVLADHAATGIPSLVTLRDSFPDAARAGLQAALSQDMGATWGERVTNFLRSQTGLRALTPQEGTDPDAVLSRIDAALRAADMPAVMAEIAQLSAPAQGAMTDWIVQAQTRADALAALAALTEKGQ